MPKGRKSNEHRRNRRLDGRRPRSDEKAQQTMERGHTKLLALFDRSRDVQKRRRKKAKKALASSK
jgi:hypothetical protein